MVNPAPKLKDILLGAGTGAYSHVMLDNIAWSTQPLLPFSDSTHSARVLGLGQLHTICFLSGATGFAILLLVHWHRRNRSIIVLSATGLALSTWLLS